MERRRKICVFVLDKDKMEDIPPNARLATLRPDLTAYVWGIPIGFEEEGRTAIQWALQNLSEGRRIAVLEIDVHFDDRSIQVDDKRARALLDQCEDGECIVDPEVAKIYERLFLFEHVEEPSGDRFFLRGKRKRPSRLYGFHGHNIALIGRQKEIASLQALVAQIIEDQGQIAEISGDAGIGKTRLKEEFQEYLIENDIPFAETQFRENEPLQFEAFASLMKAFIPDEPSSLADEGLSEVEILFLRSLVRRQDAFAELKHMSEADIREGVFLATQKLLFLRSRTPLVLFFENFHFANPMERMFFSVLTKNIEKTKLLLVLLQRDRLQNAWDKNLNFNLIELKPLSQSETNQLLQEATGANFVARTFEEELLRASKGNPLFIEEVLRKFQHEGNLEIEPMESGRRVLRAKKNAEITIPSTLQSIIASRFDRLEPLTKERLKWLSLLGSNFFLDEAAELFRRRNLYDENWLKELENEQYIEEKSIFPDKVFRFHHDLIHEVIAKSMPPKEQRNRHGIIGELLLDMYSRTSPEVLFRAADHYLASDRDLETIRITLKAGNVAFAHYQYSLAEKLLSASANLWESLPILDPAPHEVYAPLMETFLILGDWKSAEDVLRKWKSHGTPSHPRIHGLLAGLELQYFHSTHRYREAVESSHSALEAYGPDPLYEKQRFDIVHDRIDSLIHLGDVPRAMHETMLILREINDGRYPYVRMRLWSRAAHCALASGNGVEALNYIDKAQQLLTDEYSPHWRLELELRASETLQSFYRMNDASLRLTRVVEMSRKSGLRRYYYYGLLERAKLSCRMGRFRTTMEDLKVVREEAARLGDHFLERKAMIYHLDSLLEIGAIDEAEETSNLLKDHATSQADDLWLSAEECLAMAKLYESRLEFKEAALCLSRARKIYQELQHAMLRDYVAFLEIAFSSRSKNLHPNDLEAMYWKHTVYESRIQFPPWHDARRVAALWIDHPNQGAIVSRSAEIDPEQCPWISLRRDLYRAQLRWFEEEGNSSALNILKERFRAFHGSFQDSLPLEYRSTWPNHPLYSF